MESDHRESTLEELQILEAMALAIDRREEIFRAIESTQTREDALGATTGALGVGESQARAVLDMQARRWTQGERRKITGHLAMLHSKLDSL